MHDRERKRIPDHRSDVESEKESREMKQLREVWRSCTGDNMEADGSYFVSNSAADW